MRKILDQRDDLIMQQLWNMNHQIPTSPTKVAGFLYELSATLESRNDEVKDLSILNAQTAARENFMLVSQHFIRQRDYETLLVIAPFA